MKVNLVKRENVEGRKRIEVGKIIKGGREKWADMETIMGRGAGEGDYGCAHEGRGGGGGEVRKE